MNAFARYCAAHNVDPNDWEASSKAYKRWNAERSAKRQTRAEREHELDAEQMVNVDPLEVLR